MRFFERSHEESQPEKPKRPESKSSELGEFAEQMKFCLDGIADAKKRADRINNSPEYDKQKLDQQKAEAEREERVRHYNEGPEHEDQVRYSRAVEQATIRDSARINAVARGEPEPDIDPDKAEKAGWETEPVVERPGLLRIRDRQSFLSRTLFGTPAEEIGQVQEAQYPSYIAEHLKSREQKAALADGDDTETK